MGYEKFDILSVFHEPMLFQMTITKNLGGDANNLSYNVVTVS